MNAAMGECIVRIDIARCSLPLSRPVHVGRTIYRDREYVALRLVTTAGIEGHAIGYTRGLPLDAMVRLLVDAILARRASARSAIVESMRDMHVNAAGSLGRAFSLVDIALADVEARAAGLPLWKLLGAARSSVPVMAVAGYHSSTRGTDEVVAEVRALVDRGILHIKLHSSDLGVVTAVLSSLDSRVSVGVDMGMAWRSLSEARAGIGQFDDLGLAFIEDPFPPERWHLTAELASQARTPIAAGEDASSPELLSDIASAVAVLRVDATVSGGFAAVLEVAQKASSRGVAVMTHAFPDQHAHLAGHASIGLLEMIPDETGLNPVGQLLARRQTLEGGRLTLSEEPGHGAPLDWATVERRASEMTSHTITELEAGQCN